MEVHHHAHTARKKWTHYFWEFLMLFLAVFCGFLAEYQLEHKIERDRGKQYAKTLYDDIKIDTATLQLAIRTNEFITNRIDTFRFLVQHQPIQSIPSGTWYYFGRFGTRDIELTFQDATIEQLIKSGGLRYFKSFRVNNAIARYDKACKDLRYWMAAQTIFSNELLSQRNRIYNSYYLDAIMDITISDSKIDSFKRSSFPLLSTKKDDFIQYANTCQVRSSNYKFLQGKNKDVLKKGEELLALLKKEYHLK